MDKKLTMIIAAVVVIIVIAAAAALVIGKNDSKEKDGGDTEITYGDYTAKTATETGNLWIYGNADNDYDLDQDDVKFIQDIIDGKKKWDKEANPYCDTNVDGIIDEQDVALLKKYINNESALMFYDQYWAGNLSVSYIHYPITGDLGAMYWQAMSSTTILGLWDKVTAVDGVICIGDAYEARYPGVGQKFAMGSPDELSAENVLQSGISALVAYVAADGTGEQVQKDLRAMGSKIDVIALPMSGADCVRSMPTLGVLLGAEEAAAKYTAYNQKVSEYVNSEISKVSKSDYAEYIVVYNPKNADRIEIEATNQETGVSCGGISFIQLLPATNIHPYGDAGSYFAYRTAEWFVAEDPEYIIISGSTGTSAITYDEAQEKFNGYLDMFKGTTAYAEKKIIGVGYGLTTSYSGYAGLGLIAAYLYPNIIDSEKGYEFLQEWYDNFTNEKVDAKKVGGGIVRML